MSEREPPPQPPQVVVKLYTLLIYNSCASHLHLHSLHIFFTQEFISSSCIMYIWCSIVHLSPHSNIVHLIQSAHVLNQCSTHTCVCVHLLHYITFTCLLSSSSSVIYIIHNNNNNNTYIHACMHSATLRWLCFDPSSLYVCVCVCVCVCCRVLVSSLSPFIIAFVLYCFVSIISILLVSSHAFFSSLFLMFIPFGLSTLGLSNHFLFYHHSKGFFF